MTASDPKKVALLAVVAVGACGYLLFSVLGMAKGENPAGRLAEQDREGSKNATTPGLVLVGDPFVHPTLVRNKSAAIKATKTAGDAAGGTPSDSAASGAPSGPWRPFDPQVGGRVPGLLGGSPSEAAPDENAGKSRPKEQESRTTVRLSAVMNADRAVALLSVRGGDSRAFREGDEVVPGWRLAAIDDAGIILGGKKGARRLAVGAEVEL